MLIEEGAVVGIDHLVIDAFPNPQPGSLDTGADFGRTADQHRMRDAFVADDLHRAQNAAVLTLGKDDAPGSGPGP